MFHMFHIHASKSIVIIIITTTTTILGIPFMQGIYTYIPETNHVPRGHCVAAIIITLHNNPTNAHQ
jgi:hypothetical protein